MRPHNMPEKNTYTSGAPKAEQPMEGDTKPDQLSKTRSEHKETHHAPVSTTVNQLEWAGELRTKPFQRKRAVVSSHQQVHYCCVKYEFVTEYSAEEFVHHIDQYKTASVLHQRLLGAALQYGYIAEEEAEVYVAPPPPVERRGITSTARGLCQAAIHSEYLENRFNDQVKLYSPMPCIAKVSVEQHAMKTVTCHGVNQKDDAYSNKTKSAHNPRLAGRKHEGHRYSAPALVHHDPPRVSTASSKTTVIDIAGEYQVILPADLPEAPDKQVLMSLGQVLKNAKIEEPFYMRHIYADSNSPDKVIIVPKSMVNKGVPRRLSIWQPAQASTSYQQKNMQSKEHQMQTADANLPMANKQLKKLEKHYTNELEKLQRDMQKYMAHSEGISHIL